MYVLMDDIGKYRGRLELAASNASPLTAKVDLENDLQHVMVCTGCAALDRHSPEVKTDTNWPD
jgi:hypothetical protein